jgi:hypothetical protein
VKTTRRVKIEGIDHVLYSSSSSYTPYDDWTDKGVFYIPIEGDDYVQRARITIGYTVERTGGTNYPATGDEATVAKNVILHEQTDYGPGKRLNFNISLGSTIPLSNE